MKFTLNEDLGIYESKVDFRSASVEIWIGEPCLQEKLESETLAALEKIEGHWTQINDNIVKSLFATYKDHWVDTDQVERLNPVDFAHKIILKVIEIDDGAITLTFDDSGLFGGHDVEIFWDDDGKMYDANLQG